MGNQTIELFIHIDPSGIYPGNGGMLMLTLLAIELRRFDVRTYLFNPTDQLNKSQFEWMSLDEDQKWDLHIGKWANIRQAKGPILTGWVRGLLKNHSAGILSDLAPRLRVWCHDELLRTDSQEAIGFVQCYGIPLAITNPELYREYVGLKLNPVQILPLWIRSDFNSGANQNRLKGFIGYQQNTKPDAVGAALRARYGAERVMNCVGTQDEVRRRMQICEYFVHFPPPKNLIYPGEGLGLPAFEAAACGCVPLAGSHPGNARLPRPFRFDTLERLFNTLDLWLSGEHHASILRELAYNTIQESFRFETRRAGSWLAFMEGH